MRSTLITLAILLCIGCGTRKSSINLSKTNVKEESKEVSSGSSNTESKSTASTETNEQVAKTDEKQESRTRELYDENGKLKERITELINSKSADNSKRSAKSSYEITTTVKMVITQTKLRTLNIHTKDKQKSTTTNRNGLYYLLGVLGIIGLAFWLKPWMR